MIAPDTCMAMLTICIAQVLQSVVKTGADSCGGGYCNNRESDEEGKGVHEWDGYVF